MVAFPASLGHLVDDVCYRDQRFGVVFAMFAVLALFFEILTKLSNENIGFKVDT